MTRSDTYLLGHDPAELARLEHQARVLAAHRAGQRGLTNVSFVNDDLHTAGITGEFDAVVGRLILLYLPEPDQVLRRFAGMVRPGGVVAVMEFEMTAAGTLPHARMAAQTVRTLLPVLESTGVATPDEIDVDTLEERFLADSVAHNAIFKPPTLVGGWARVA